MKFVTARPFADPDAAARKLVEIANAAEAVQDGRIHIELINAAFLTAGGSPDEYRAGIERAISKGWLCGMRAASTSGSPRPGPSCSSDALVRPLPRSDTAAEGQAASHAPRMQRTTSWDCRRRFTTHHTDRSRWSN
jgi:hypothetical protein